MHKSEKIRKRTPAPSPLNISKAMSAAVRCRKKFGRKRFRRNEKFVERVTSKIVERYELEGTISQPYWVLKIKVILKGHEQTWM
jgi:hypothetical protein